MATLAEIQEQIKKLQADEKVKIEEHSAAIVEIQELMSKHGVKLEELKDAPKKERKVSVPKAKYKNPNSEETWSGRGRKPKWVVDQLAAGRELEDFLIKD